MYVDDKQRTRKRLNENTIGFSSLTGTKSLRVEAFRAENNFLGTIKKKSFSNLISRK